MYKARELQAPGVGTGGIVRALDYLIASNRKGFGDEVPAFDEGTLNADGKRVVVIGGGDTAMDCVRTAVRQGATSVKCLYRRDRANMPGSAREVQNAEEEGVEFVWLAAPTAFHDQDGRVAAVQGTRMKLGPPGPDGRRQPEPGGEEFREVADLVVMALGFSPEDLPQLFGAPELGVTRWGTLRTDHKTLMTSLDGVFRRRRHRPRREPCRMGDQRRPRRGKDHARISGGEGSGREGGGVSMKSWLLIPLLLLISSCSEAGRAEETRDNFASAAKLAQEVRLLDRVSRDQQKEMIRQELLSTLVVGYGRRPCDPSEPKCLAAAEAVAENYVDIVINERRKVSDSLLSSYFARHLSEDEIERTLAFVRSDAGTAFVKAIRGFPDEPAARQLFTRKPSSAGNVEQRYFNAFYEAIEGLPEARFRAPPPPPPPPRAAPATEGKRP